MKLFLLFLLGLVIGVVGTFVFVGSQAPAMMILTTPSANDVPTTLDRLQAAAKADDWKVLGVRGLHESVKKHTGKDVKPVWVVDLCEPHHAGKILGEDDSRVVSPFMPCTISVYEGPDGKARVGAMNAKLLGTLFGGTVKEVMAGQVADAQAKFVEAATAPAAAPEPAKD